MGKPDDSIETEHDLVMEVASLLLHPTAGVPADLLRSSGLHRVMVANAYELLVPEIKNLIGWKPLGEYTYTIRENVSIELYSRANAATKLWREKLDALEMGGLFAVLLYDGERSAPPSPNYRLFLLRDGRILHYDGGVYPTFYSKEIVYGEALAVLEALDKRYPLRRNVRPEDPFMVMTRAFSRALGIAIDDRRRKLATQEGVQAAIDAIAARVTFK